jgi:hypothetical protein
MRIARVKVSGQNYIYLSIRGTFSTDDAADFCRKLTIVTNNAVAANKTLTRRKDTAERIIREKYFRERVKALVAHGVTNEAAVVQARTELQHKKIGRNGKLE